MAISILYHHDIQYHMWLCKQGKRAHFHNKGMIYHSHTHTCMWPHTQPMSQNNIYLKYAHVLLYIILSTIEYIQHAFLVVASCNYHYTSDVSMKMCGIKPNHTKTQQNTSWVHISWDHYGDVIIGAIASQITNLTIVYSTVYSGADRRKHQSSASLDFVRWIHRWIPHTKANKADNASIWWRHHDVVYHPACLFW